MFGIEIELSYQANIVQEMIEITLPPTTSLYREFSVIPLPRSLFINVSQHLHLFLVRWVEQ